MVRVERIIHHPLLVLPRFSQQVEHEPCSTLGGCDLPVEPDARDPLHVAGHEVVDRDALLRERNLEGFESHI